MDAALMISLVGVIKIDLSQRGNFSVQVFELSQMKKNFVFFYLIFLVGIALISGTALSKTFQETRLSQQAMHCSEIFSVFSQFYSKDSDQGSSFFKAIDIFTDVVLKELRLPVSNDRLEAMALQRSEAAKILLSNRSMQMTNLREDAVMCGAWADGFLSQGTRYQYVPVYPKVVAPDSSYQNPVVAINGQHIFGLTSLGQIFISQFGGSLSVLTSAAAVNDGNFHWVELEYYLNGASSTAQIFIDGVSQGTYTGNLGSQVAISSVSVGLGYVFTGSGWIDDVIIWDDQGSSFNTFPLGPRRISTLQPNADGDLAQFTPKTGTAHFAMVNGGYSSTNYVSDTGTGNVDLFKFPALAYTPANINLVVGYFYGQNTGSGSTSLTPKLKTGGTTISGATQTLSVGTYTVTQAPFLTDASGAAWTAAAVNAMQIGMGD